MRDTIGFIGAGTLTESVVVALCEKFGTDLPIVLSPRSQATSSRLAARFSNVSVASCNAEVVNRSNTVVLATRPQQIDDALQGIVFRPDHTVISFIAKMTLAEVEERVCPASSACRVTPLPAIVLKKGPIVFFPPVDAVTDLFSGLGELIVASSEQEALALGDAAGLMSSYFQLQSGVIQWLAAHGASETNASRYTRTMLEALAATAMHTPDDEQSLLVMRHETLGGLNARCREALTKARWFDQVESTLDTLRAKASLRSRHTAS
jgi:pyrroline-5-carboxylate reductase